MWLFYLETYLFVLVAFTLGVAVGLLGVRLAVRRTAPEPAPSASGTPGDPVAQVSPKRSRRKRQPEPTATTEAGAGAASTSTGGSAS